MANKDNPILKW